MDKTDEGEAMRRARNLFMSRSALHREGDSARRAKVGCPQDPKENSFPAQKGTHEANLMLASSNRREASSVGGPSD